MSATRLNALRLATLLALGLSQLSLADNTDEKTADGLQLVEKNRRLSLYVAPDVDWAKYTEVQLLDSTVEFRRHWQRDQNSSWAFKVKDEDVAEIKQEMAELVSEVFGQELTENGGYTLADGSGEQVLTVRPAITELDVAAPDTQNWAGISRQYTESSGRMTLQLELVDSVSGKVLSRFKERDEVPRTFDYQLTTSVSNEADARRLLRRWAVDLRERLDAARSEPALLANSD